MVTMLVGVGVGVSLLALFGAAACSSSVVSPLGRTHASPSCINGALDPCDAGAMRSEPPLVGSGGAEGASPSTGSGGSSGSTSGASGLGGTSPIGAGGDRSPIGAGGARSRSDGGVPGPSDAGQSDGRAPPAVGAAIPPILVDCPKWESGVISFMGLDGIRIEAGAKPAGLVPMLVYWHATASTSDEYTKVAAGVTNGVTSAGGVIVSFQGTTGGDLYSGVNVWGAGDLELVDQLVACAVRDRGVDARRIYAMGCSAGGLFTAAMAALRSQYVAAAVATMGGWVIDVPFASGNTPALMTVHQPPGTSLIVDFAQASAVADKAFGARGGFVVDCQTSDRTCDSGADAWAFLEAHPFGVTPEPWAGGLPAGFSAVCSIR